MLYTPSVSNSPGGIAKDVAKLRMDLLLLTEAALQRRQGNEKDWILPDPTSQRVELLIVDEADRLKIVGLEQLYIKYNLNLGGS